MENVRKVRYGGVAWLFRLPPVSVDRMSEMELHNTVRMKHTLSAK